MEGQFYYAPSVIEASNDGSGAPSFQVLVYAKSFYWNYEQKVSSVRLSGGGLATTSCQVFRIPSPPDPYGIASGQMYAAVSNHGQTESTEAMLESLDENGQVLASQTMIVNWVARERPSGPNRN